MNFPFFKQLDSKDCGSSCLRKKAKGSELSAHGKEQITSILTLNLILS